MTVRGIGKKRAERRMQASICQGKRRLDSRKAICQPLPRNPRRTMPQMTTAEAIVAGLIAHGLDTIYALPGVQNDHLFDALFKAQDRIRTIHTRHEQGAAYMALGAALATSKPQAFAVVPGPGLLNASAALLTAYSMNAPLLALVGQIPDRDIGRKLGQLHEINDQAGIVDRLVGEKHAWFVPHAKDAPRIVAEAFRTMATGRPGPAAVECAINVWGKPGNVTPCEPDRKSTRLNSSHVPL